MEAFNSPEDSSTYQLKKGEVKMVRPKYNRDTGEFLGLYKTVGFIVARGFPIELFFNYGYYREKSKVFHLRCRRRIPNSFSGTIFNRHRTVIESGAVDGEKSNTYFFLPFINDRSKGISIWTMFQFLHSTSRSNNLTCGLAQFLTLLSLICTALIKN